MNILQAMRDPDLFAGWFRDEETWAAWVAFLCALFALPMTEEQRTIYRECTGRHAPPEEALREAWLICGRRAGKSFVLALIAVFLATFRDYRPYLQPGERATVLVIATDRKQARVIFRYIAAFLSETPSLKPLIERETADAFDLTNGVTIEIATASFRRTRGYAIAAAIVDEIAFLPTEDSANPDHELIAAIRPGQAQFPNAMLLCASSPYARRGALWDAYERWYGQDGAKALIWKAPTRRMNPTVPQSFIDEETERDPANAAAEYGAEFRSDIEAFLSREAINACVDNGIRERQPNRQLTYYGFVDPSGGGADSFAMGIAHREGQSVILDLVREVRPAEGAFNPEAICGEFAGVLRSYRISTVSGDRYAGSWPAAMLQRFGIGYTASLRSKSEIYVDTAPLINSGAAALLDNDRLVRQMTALERRTARGGRSSIDHPPGAGHHDDLCNAACGALLMAWKGVAAHAIEPQFRTTAPPRSPFDDIDEVPMPRDRRSARPVPAQDPLSEF